MEKRPEAILAFLNSVTPRIGPANALGLAKDAHMNAIFEMLKGLGVSSNTIDTAIERHLKQTAQNVLQTPVLSPIQKLP